MASGQLGEKPKQVLKAGTTNLQVFTHLHTTLRVLSGQLLDLN